MVSQIYNGQIMRLYFMKKYKYTAQLYSSLKTHTLYQGYLYLINVIIWINLLYNEIKIWPKHNTMLRFCFHINASCNTYIVNDFYKSNVNAMATNFT